MITGVRGESTPEWICTDAARRTRLSLAIALSSVALLALAHPARMEAQTPVTALGLGYPVVPLDARATALGGIGIALPGGSLSIRNPADLTQFETSELSISLAPESADMLPPGEKNRTNTGRNRFSLLRAVVPIGKWAFGIGFGSELDQDWMVSFSDTLRSSFGRFPFDEQRESNGGLSTVNLSLARKVGPISIGGSYERLTGNVRQLFSRRFEPAVDVSAPALAPLRETALWRYSSWRLRGGITLQPTDRIRVGGSIMWTSDLTALRDNGAASRRFQMPLGIDVGASARLSPTMLVTAGGGWTGWSRTDGDLVDARAADVYWGGVGFEYLGLIVGRLVIPMRAGARFTDLPFFAIGASQIRETSFGLGTGLDIAGGGAHLDGTLEFGQRGSLKANALDETFRRFTLSITLRQ